MLHYTLDTAINVCDFPLKKYNLTCIAVYKRNNKRFKHSTNKLVLRGTHDNLLAFNLNFCKLSVNYFRTHSYKPYILDVEFINNDLEFDFYDAYDIRCHRVMPSRTDAGNYDVILEGSEKNLMYWLTTVHGEDRGYWENYSAEYNNNLKTARIA